MTIREAEELVAQYRVGLETELVLLRQLAALAEHQQSSSQARDFETLSRHSDDRDRVTRGLAVVEKGLGPVRERLATDKELTMTTPGWGAIVQLRHEAAALVSQVQAADRESLRLLADAEMARRAALSGLEKGESTLAAYRRVITPPVEHAALVDRRG